MKLTQHTKIGEECEPDIVRRALMGVSRLAFLGSFLTYRVARGRRKDDFLVIEEARPSFKISKSQDISTITSTTYWSAHIAL